MTPQFNNIAEIIENSRFYKTYGFKSIWVSGSSTYVRPITFWVENKEVDIQLNVFRIGKRVNKMAQNLIDDIAKYTNVGDWYIIKNDGSCPNVLRFYIK